MTEQDILDYINEYRSLNHVDMIRGTHFDWQKEYYEYGNPTKWDRYIWTGGFSGAGMWYFREEKIASIAGVRIYCETSVDAELLILAYLKANNDELGALYTREHIKPE